MVSCNDNSGLTPFKLSRLMSGIIFNRTEKSKIDNENNKITISLLNNNTVFLNCDNISSKSKLIDNLIGAIQICSNNILFNTFILF